MSAPLTTFTITIVPQGWQFPAEAGTTILAAAELAGMWQRQVRYTVDWPGISPDERLDGYILPCVAVAESDLTVQARAVRK